MPELTRIFTDCQTDARAVNGLEDAVERGKLYLDNGAEALL